MLKNEMDEKEFNIIKSVKDVSRRDFLKSASSIALGTLLFPSQIFAKTDDIRKIHIRNIHTGKSINAVYYENGAYISDAIYGIYEIMEDYRRHEIREIDNNLIDLLHTIQNYAGGLPIELLSGYRSPETNNELRRHRRGVAKHSYHILGKAADIRIPKVPLHLLKRIAMHLRRGGVGYYPRSGFVHVDVGPVRHWRG